MKMIRDDEAFHDAKNKKRGLVGGISDKEACHGNKQDEGEEDKEDRREKNQQK